MNTQSSSGRCRAQATEPTAIAARKLKDEASGQETSQTLYVTYMSRNEKQVLVLGAIVAKAYVIVVHAGATAV